MSIYYDYCRVKVTVAFPEVKGIVQAPASMLRSPDGDMATALDVVDVANRRARGAGAAPDIPLGLGKMVKLIEF